MLRCDRVDDAVERSDTHSVSRCDSDAELAGPAWIPKIVKKKKNTKPTS